MRTLILLLVGYWGNANAQKPRGYPFLVLGTAMEADGQAVKIHTTDDIIYEVKVNLGHLLSQLPHFEPYLPKVSRRRVVNIQAIEAIEGNLLFIKGHQVPISRRFHGSVMEQLPLISSRSHIHTS